MTEVERLMLRLLSVLVMFETAGSGADNRAALAAGRSAVDDVIKLLENTSPS